MFVSEDDRYFGFGTNYYGQLGLGDTERRTTPVELISLKGIKAKFVESGLQFTVLVTGLICFVSLWLLTCFKEDNKIFVWGINEYGELGLGDTENRTTPTELKSLTKVNVTSISCSYLAVLLVSGLSHRFTDLEIDFYHSQMTTECLCGVSMHMETLVLETLNIDQLQQKLRV